MFGNWREPTSERLRGRRAVEDRLRFLRLHTLCLHCLIKGRTTVATQVDHVMPFAKGGYDIDSNKQSLCDPCHKAKTARDFGHRQRQAIGIDGYPEEQR